MKGVPGDEPNGDSYEDTEDDDPWAAIDGSADDQDNGEDTEAGVEHGNGCVEKHHLGAAPSRGAWIAEMVGCGHGPILYSGGRGRALSGRRRY